MIIPSVAKLVAVYVSGCVKFYPPVQELTIPFLTYLLLSLSTVTDIYRT